MSVDEKALNEFLTNKEALCLGTASCNFCIKEIRTREKKISEDEIAHRIDEAILLCTGCGLIEPIEFENRKGDY